MPPAVWHFFKGYCPLPAVVRQCTEGYPLPLLPAVRQCFEGRTAPRRLEDATNPPFLGLTGYSTPSVYKEPPLSSVPGSVAASRRHHCSLPTTCSLPTAVGQ